MKNIITSTHTKWKCLSSIIFLALLGNVPSFAQINSINIDQELKQKSFYPKLPKAYYIVTLPIQGCFTCEALLNSQVQSISRKNKIVIIYPSTRKIVEDKIKKENNLDSNNAIYVFDNNLYQKCYDPKAPKGYTKKIQK